MTSGVTTAHLVQIAMLLILTAMFYGNYHCMSIAFSQIYARANCINFKECPEKHKLTILQPWQFLAAKPQILYINQIVNSVFLM